MGILKEKILHVDVVFFKMININMHNDLLAYLMKFTANDIFLGVIVIGTAVYIIVKGKKQNRVYIAAALWTLIITNIISTKLLKPFFGRQRPILEIPETNMLVVMKTYGYAFPSTHTAMAMALVVVMWAPYKKLRPYMSVFVFCVGFFCVYTGGHYPFDVVAGAILGGLTGTIATKLMRLKKNSKMRNQGVDIEKSRN